MNIISKYSITALIAVLPIIPVLAQEDTIPDTSIEYYDLILKVSADDPQTDIDYLTEKGIKVLNHRHEICLTLIPGNVDIDEILGDLPSLRDREENEYADSSDKRLTRSSKKVKRLSHLRASARKAELLKSGSFVRNVPAMQVSRTNYDLQATLTHPDVISRIPELSGKGVVVGFSDIGFDAKHINFRNADGTELRVKKAVQIKESEGVMEIYETPEEILAWHTDDDDNFHATHVAGILSGGYKHNDMYGIAYDADIVATTSQLTDCGILAGVEEIIAYAKKVDKPAVINISLANYTGAHDGSSLFCQYLDRCAEDAAICVASGNAGTSTQSLSRDLTPDNDSLLMLIYGMDWVHFNISGVTDIYGETSDPITITLQTLTYPVKAANLYYESPVLDFSERDMYILTSDESKKDIDGYIYSEKWAEAMNGEIMALGEVDPENGRYHVMVMYNTSTTRKASDKYNWAHYYTAIKANGTAGQRMDAFADGVQSTFGKIVGYTPAPNAGISVNNLATGHNIISVGQYVAQEGVANLGGAVWGAGETPGQISAYSGYGYLIDGRILPVTVAPGTPIVSSMSGAFIRKYNGESITNMKVAESVAYPQGEISTYSDDDAEDIEETEETYHYWGPYGGTSMASPYAAGVVALMKQINPDLTSAEIIKRIQDSNDTENHAYSTDPRNGQGFLHSSQLLLNLISDIPTSVETITGGEAKYLATVNNGDIHIINPDQHSIKIEIYSTDGICLVSKIYNNEKNISHNIADLPSALYLIRISSPTAEVQNLKIMK